MKRILLLLVAAIGAAFLMGGKTSADHYPLDPIATPKCELSPCVIEIGNHFGAYGDSLNDPDYQQAMEMLVADLSKSGVYLKLVPSTVFAPDIPTDLEICFPPDSQGHERENYWPCSPNECQVQTPYLPGYNCVQNYCTTRMPLQTDTQPPNWLDVGGDIAVCFSGTDTKMELNSSFGWGVHVNCWDFYGAPSGCDDGPMGREFKRSLCHELGHALGLNHYDTGCMYQPFPRINVHDANSINLWHPPLGANCIEYVAYNDQCLAHGTVADADEDNDGVENFAEGRCGDGSVWNNPSRVPERLGNGVDDNNNGLTDELLWTSHVNGWYTDIWTPDNIGAVDCDGDGYLGNSERHIFGMGTNPSKDQDRCGNAQALRSGYSYAQSGSWPSDLNMGSFSPNKIDVLDITSFIAPFHVLDTSLGEPYYDIRWDLQPGKGVFNEDINVTDLTYLQTNAPPMFGVVAYNSGLSCTD